MSAAPSVVACSPAHLNVALMTSHARALVAPVARSAADVDVARFAVRVCSYVDTSRSPRWTRSTIYERPSRGFARVETPPGSWRFRRLMYV